MPHLPPRADHGRIDHAQFRAPSHLARRFPQHLWSRPTPHHAAVRDRLRSAERRRGEDDNDVFGCDLVSLASAFRHRRDRWVKQIRLDRSPIVQRPIEVVVQGDGVWVRDALQPDLRALHVSLLAREHPGLYVSYVGLATESKLELDDFESYYCRDDKDDVEELADRSFDLILIASPDYAHIGDVRRWLEHGNSSPKAIVVEKPFSNESFEIEQLQGWLKDLADGDVLIPPILGCDHYTFYVAPYMQSDLSRIDDFIGEVCRVVFFMLERKEIEDERLRSLGSGMTFDMLSHFLGLLSLFCDLRTYTSVNVPYAARHRFEVFPELRSRKYFAETVVEAELLVRLWNEPTNVKAYCRVGKAAAVDAKYLQFVGEEGRVARIRCSFPNHDDPEETGLFFASAHTSKAKHRIPDRSESETYLEIEDGIERSGDATWSRHGHLVDAIATGDFALYELLLTIEECRLIVKGLEDVREQVLQLSPHDPGQQEWRKQRPWRSI